MLEDQVKLLLTKVDNLEHRGRRNNLIIHGIEELPAETSDKVTTRITNENFKTWLGTTIGRIERCHRIGSHSDNKL